MQLYRMCPESRAEGALHRCVHVAGEVPDARDFAVTIIVVYGVILLDERHIERPLVAATAVVRRTNAIAACRGRLPVERHARRAAADISIVDEPIERARVGIRR